MTVTSSIGLKVLEMETSLYGEKANGGLLGEGQAGDIREAGVVSGCGVNICHLEWQRLRGGHGGSWLLRLFTAAFSCLSLAPQQRRVKRKK